MFPWLKLKHKVISLGQSTVEQTRVEYTRPELSSLARVRPGLPGHLMTMLFSQVNCITIDMFYTTGGKHKAFGLDADLYLVVSYPPPCFIQPSTLFLPGGSTKLLAPS